MIVRERPRFFQLFFILRGSVLPRIYPQLLVVFATSALVVWGHRTHPGLVPTIDGAPFALLGIALSVFLGFRNNACYERWWEARRDWGQLVFTCRDLARQTQLLQVMSEDGARARQDLLRLAVAFAHTLVVLLRPRTDGANGANAYIPQELQSAIARSRNPADFLLRHMGLQLAVLSQAGMLTDIQFGLIDATLGRMSAVLAACERIKTTPVPFAYTLLLHRTAYLFCLLLPFGFADALGWSTPFAASLVAYTFFGLDALSDELEKPFGDLANDLPIQALATTIEINLREALGETDLPPLPQPKDYILM